MQDVNVKFIPKGGMCAVCLFSNEDCSKMDFKSMPPIRKSKGDDIVIVRCISFCRAGNGK